MARHLENELDRLKKRLLSLSSAVEKNLSLAVNSVSERNESIALQAIQADNNIDLMEVEVEEDCLKILALHQPVAIDLRYIIATLKINNDLERIADLAVNVAERAIVISRSNPIDAPFDFEDMASKTRVMLRNALVSLIEMNTDLAHKVCIADDEVDEINRDMYSKVFKGLKETPEHIELLIQYLSVSRHLERIADYATNIAEDVIYMIEGEIVRHRPEAFSGN